jgi:Mg2+ and Co2+ transporter CorA
MPKEDEKLRAGVSRDDADTLPRSIFVPQEDPRKQVRETIDSILSDRFMAFLSIILIPIIVLPLFFNFSSQVLDFFEICDATIIVFFVVEYVAKLYLARSRWEYFKSPWHLVDLAVILLSFISYLPFLGLKSKGSTTLLLRLLRLPRALAVGGRTAGSRMKATETTETIAEKAPETVIRQVGADMTVGHENLTWEEVERHLGTNDEEWIDIHNITEEGVLRLAGMLRVLPRRFKTNQFDEISPHIEYAQQMSFIFLQSGQIKYPEVPEHYFTISRLGEVVICRGPKIISATPHGIDIFKRSLEDMRSHLGEHKFAVSVLYGILDSSLKEYRSIFSEIEFEIGKIGNTPKSKLPKDFLQRTYELNKEVVRMVSNLVHFKELLGVAISKRVPLEGFDESAEEDFQSLQEETSYLNEVADDIVDHLRTIIDLYINQSSYETNRILRILAVITSLAVIPSAIGGILGMNLLDVPYRFELWQIVLVIVIAMAFVGYCFTKLGWLKA